MNTYFIAGMIEDVIGGLLGGLGKAVFGFLVALLQFVFGWVNDLLCLFIDIVVSLLPSTPPTLKLSYLLSTALNKMTFGQSIVVEIFTMLSSFLLVVLAIKLYKLIPFKMS